jgi:oligopeptide transport system substrate-binding protein
MHRNKWLSVLLVGLLVIATVMTATNLRTTKAQEPKVLRTAYLPGDVILDPSLATWTNEIQLIDEMFPGLTSLNELTVATEPGIASDWTASEDGLTYTFNLIHDIPWVKYDADKGEVVQVTDDAGAVRVVKAQDIVYGVNRTLNPDTASQYASTLAPWIVGGNEMLAGEAVTLGVTAIDDYTLEIKSPKPAGFLPMMYGLWMSRPEPEWAITENADAWTEAGNVQTYGPYTIKTWEHDVEITMVKNPFWPGTDYMPQATIDEWVFTYLEEPAMLAAFEAGELDWIPSVPLPDLDRLRAEYPDELVFGPSTCTYYYGFNTEKEPTNNAHLRRALSMAIDRAAVVTITNSGETPAGFFTRPDIAAAPSQDAYPDDAIWSDPEKAKAEFQAYLDETGNTIETMPSITLGHNTSTNHVLIAQAIEQMWKDTLGITATDMAQDAQTYNATLRTDAPQVWRLGWCYDYPDPNSFINDVFRSKGPDSNNHTGWGPDDFYALLDQAGVETNPDARRELYAQAEYILVNRDAAVAPIYYYTSRQMTQTNIDRTYSVNNHERMEKWDIK